MESRVGRSPPDRGPLASELDVTTHAPPLPLGIDDFRTVRERGLAYVDRSDAIAALLDRPGDCATILLGPRRVGKSLALSALRYFLERSEESLEPLFAGLAIWQQGERYRRQFQRYPVLSMRFGDLRFTHARELASALRERLRDLADEHRQLLECDGPSPLDRERIGALLDGSASPTLFARALRDLVSALHRAHDRKVVVLVDDYDAPIRAAQRHGFAPEARALIGGLLRATVNSPHLERTILTGVTSATTADDELGLGSAYVFDVLAESTACVLGFREDEVATLLAEREREHDLPTLRRWYGGLGEGVRERFHPWSVMHYLDAPARGPQPYALLAGIETHLRPLLQRHADELRPQLERLWAGDELERSFTGLTQVEGSEQAGLDTAWRGLVDYGYLAAERIDGDGAPRAALYRLWVPNRELLLLHQVVVRAWLDEGIPHTPSAARAASPGVALRHPPAAAEDGAASAEATPLPRDHQENAAAFETRLAQFFDEMHAGAAALPARELDAAPSADEPTADVDRSSGDSPPHPERGGVDDESPT